MKRSNLYLAFALLILVASCSSTPQFVVPEADAPEDLLVSDVPDGYELISGFELPAPGPQVRGTLPASGRQLTIHIEFADPFAFLKSPAGNVIQGVYYQSNEGLLIITKSYFPDGSLEEWQSGYMTGFEVTGDCDCYAAADAAMSKLEQRMASIVDTRTIQGVEVIVLEGQAGGWITVFMRGDYLLTVEGSLALEENLSVVANLIDG